MVDDIYNGLPDKFKTGRVLFRGFSIEKIKGIVHLQDIRKPYPSPVSEEDLVVLHELGFVDGATYLLMLSDQQKIEKFKSLGDKFKGLEIDHDNPRKKQEYVNLGLMCKTEVMYYESQVRRWQKQLNNRKVNLQWQ